MSHGGEGGGVYSTRMISACEGEEEGVAIDDN